MGVEVEVEMVMGIIAVVIAMAIVRVWVVLFLLGGAEGTILRLLILRSCNNTCHTILNFLFMQVTLFLHYSRILLHLNYLIYIDVVINGSIKTQLLHLFICFLFLNLVAFVFFFRFSSNMLRFIIVC